MSKLSANIGSTVNKLNEISRTPEGQVLLNGASNVIQLGLSALIMKKFFPAKATFGNAIGLGLIGILSSAVVGYAAVQQEKFRSTYEKDFEIAELRAQLEYLKSAVSQLNEENRMPYEDEQEMIGDSAKKQTNPDEMLPDPPDVIYLN